MSGMEEYPVVFSLPVQWGEQDAFNHVNNVAYLRWCETARILYLERIGLGQMMREKGIYCIVANISCNYRKPVTFPDTVHIGTRITKIGNSSFRMEHAVISDALGLVAEADSTLVVYDYNAQKACPMQQEIRAAITALEETVASKKMATQACRRC